MHPEHDHEPLVHQHGHSHVTHYLRPGEDVVHLTASHEHAHNHPVLRHSHEPHQDLEKEHPREAHVHDHAQPAGAALLEEQAAVAVDIPAEVSETSLPIVEPS